ncbi:MAG: hypothetical protein P4M14_10620 [Gammaproteobacteria bacterium]|nr:hypothetical protein [Gammaproteobacteria bacterium]
MTKAALTVIEQAKPKNQASNLLQPVIKKLLQIILVLVYQHNRQAWPDKLTRIDKNVLRGRFYQNLHSSIVINLCNLEKYFHYPFKMSDGIYEY